MEYKFTIPIDMSRSTHYGNNYWMFESRKVKRRVVAFSNLEYANLLTLKMNPKIKFYCEQPYKADVFISGKRYETIFDAYVVYSNGNEEFQEVKYKEELDENSEKGIRSRKQVEIQKAWCIQNEFNYNLRTDKDIEIGEYYIRNLSILAAKARRFRSLKSKGDNIIINYIQSHERTTVGYLASSGLFEKMHVLDYLADLYFRGIIILSDIENECLCNHTEVVFIGT